MKTLVLAGILLFVRLRRAPDRVPLMRSSSVYGFRAVRIGDHQGGGEAGTQHSRA